MEPLVDPAAEARIERYAKARTKLREIDPKNPELETLSEPDYVPTEQDIARLKTATRSALAAKADLGPPSEALPSGSTAPEITILTDPPIAITGRNPVELGYSFEQGIRNRYGSGWMEPIPVAGVGDVDDVVGRIAYEVNTWMISRHRSETRI